MMSVTTDLMTSIVLLAAALSDLSWAVKVSWVVLPVWAAFQVWAFRRWRIQPAVAEAAPVKAPRRTRAPRKKNAVPAAPPLHDRAAIPSLDSPHVIALPAETVYR